MVIYSNNSTTITIAIAMIDSYPSHNQRSEVFEARGLPTKYVIYAVKTLRKLSPHNHNSGTLFK